MVVGVDGRKVSNLNVTCFEDEVALIKASEEKGGEISLEEAYLDGVNYINNLGK